MNTQVQRALEILKSGDARAFDRALESLQAAVYGFGMKVCGNREDAEDTAQETLLRLARQLKNFPDARALAVWLYKVAKTQCLMSRRQSKFAPAQMLSLEALMPTQNGPAGATLKSWEITPEEIALRREFRGKLEQAILISTQVIPAGPHLARSGATGDARGGGSDGNFRGYDQNAPAPRACARPERAGQIRATR